MARSSTPVRKAWRSLGWLAAIIVVLLGIQTAGALFGGLELDAEARARPRGRHAHRARGADRRRADSHAGAARPGRLDHPPARRRVGCLRGRDQHPGCQQHRGLDSGHPRSGDPRPPAVVVEAGVPRRHPDRHAVARCCRRPDGDADSGDSASPSPSDTATPTPTPTPTDSATPNPEPTDGSDPAWVTPSCRRIRRFQLRPGRRGQGQRGTAPTSRSSPVTTPTRSSTCSAPSRSTAPTSPTRSAGRSRATRASTPVAGRVNIRFNADGAAAIKDLTTRLLPLPSPAQPVRRRARRPGDHGSARARRRPTSRRSPEASRRRRRPSSRAS